MNDLWLFTLSGGKLRRYEHQRTTPGFQAERLDPRHKPRVVVVRDDHFGVLPLLQRHHRGGTASWWHHSLYDGSLRVQQMEELLYVGEDPRSGENLFVTTADNLTGEGLAVLDWAPAKDGCVLEMSREDQAAYGLALSLVRWHMANRYCANCGSRTDATRDVGFSRCCLLCRRQHFPQLMPAMIVAVLDGKGHVILSKRTRRSEMLTVLSGFVLHGESAEETVRREVEEETGAKVKEVRYIGSQPWPHPYLLMLCYYAVADTSPNLVVEKAELEEVMWVSKREVRRALEGLHPTIKLHGPGTTPYAMLKPWVDGLVDDRGCLVSSASHL